MAPRHLLYSTKCYSEQVNSRSHYARTSTAARPAAKEEQANQQGHSEENSPIKAKDSRRETSPDSFGFPPNHSPEYADITASG